MDDKRMTVDQALAVIEQERLDVMAEGMTEEECNQIASYVLASAFRRNRTLLSEAIAEYKEDAERLNWFDAHKFTAYQSYGVNHTTLVNEEREPRRGIVKRNIRECIDATRASEMHGPLSARKSESEHG